MEAARVLRAKKASPPSRREAQRKGQRGQPSTACRRRRRTASERCVANIIKTWLLRAPLKRTARPRASFEGKAAQRDCGLLSAERGKSGACKPPVLAKANKTPKGRHPQRRQRFRGAESQTRKALACGTNGSAEDAIDDQTKTGTQAQASRRAECKDSINNGFAKGSFSVTGPLPGLQRPPPTRKDSRGRSSKLSPRRDTYPPPKRQIAFLKANPTKRKCTKGLRAATTGSKARRAGRTPRRRDTPVRSHAKRELCIHPDSVAAERADHSWAVSFCFSNPRPNRT